MPKWGEALLVTATENSLPLVADNGTTRQIDKLLDKSKMQVSMREEMRSIDLLGIDPSPTADTGNLCIFANVIHQISFILLDIIKHTTIYNNLFSHELFGISHVMIRVQHHE